MRTEDCFRKEHNAVEGEKREKEWDCEGPEVEGQEDAALIISDVNETKCEDQVNKFSLLGLFPPIITYHII